MAVREAAGAGRLWAWVRIAVGSVALVCASLLLADSLSENRAVPVREAAGAGRQRARIRIAAGSVALVCASLLLADSLSENRAVPVREAAGAGRQRARIRIAASSVALVCASLLLADSLSENRAVPVREAAGSGRLRAWIRVAGDTETLEDTLASRLIDELAGAIRVAASTLRRDGRTLVLTRHTPTNRTEVIAAVDDRRTAIISKRSAVSPVRVSARAENGPNLTGHREPVHLEEEVRINCRPVGHRSTRTRLIRPRGIGNFEGARTARTPGREIIRRQVVIDTELIGSHTRAAVQFEGANHPDDRFLLFRHVVGLRIQRLTSRGKRVSCAVVPTGRPENRVIRVEYHGAVGVAARHGRAPDARQEEKHEPNGRGRRLDARDSATAAREHSGSLLLTGAD